MAARVLGFDATVAIASLVVVYNAREMLEGALEQSTAGRTWIERTAFLAAFNVFLAVALAVGTWSNPWARKRGDLRNFDHAFERVTAVLGPLNLGMLVLAYLGHGELASALLPVAILPLVMMAAYGYAHGLRTWADGGKKSKRK